MSDEHTVALNRRARHDYNVEETVEAGLVLTGSEIKSIRAGRANLAEAYARIEKGEAWLIGAHIAPYEQANQFNHEPTRTRKLLLHRRQIAELLGKTQTKGYTLIPLRLYIRDGLAKLEIGLGRGRKAYDKRRVIAERDARRQLERETKVRVKL
jgi:SsrA-binding protein